MHRSTLDYITCLKTCLAEKDFVVKQQLEQILEVDKMLKDLINSKNTLSSIGEDCYRIEIDGKKYALKAPPENGISWRENRDVEDRDSGLGVTPYILKEASLHFFLPKHDNIVNFYGVIKRKINPGDRYKTTFLVFDFAEGNNIAGDKIKLVGFQMIANGVRKMHQCELAHRDLAPRNIFSHDGKLMLGDLGLSQRREEVPHAVPQGDSAPESCLFEIQNKACMSEYDIKERLNKLVFSIQDLESKADHCKKIKAKKIRKYLQQNFKIDTDADANPDKDLSDAEIEAYVGHLEEFFKSYDMRKIDIYQLSLLLNKMVEGQNSIKIISEYNDSRDTEDTEAINHLNCLGMMDNTDPFKRPTIDQVIDALNFAQGLQQQKIAVIPPIFPGSVIVPDGVAEAYALTSQCPPPPPRSEETTCLVC